MLVLEDRDDRKPSLPTMFLLSLKSVDILAVVKHIFRGRELPLPATHDNVPK